MHLRKKKNAPPSIEIDNIANDFETHEDVYAEINRKALTKMIQKLPPGYRAVFNMYVIEGYSHKEIADKLGININTSKSQLSKAKATLRQMLEKIMVN